MKYEEVVRLSRRYEKGHRRRSNEHRSTREDVRINLNKGGRGRKSTLYYFLNDRNSGLLKNDYLIPVLDKDNLRIYFLPGTNLNGYKVIKTVNIPFVNVSSAYDINDLLEEHNEAIGTYKLQFDSESRLWFVTLNIKKKEEES